MKGSWSNLLFLLMIILGAVGLVSLVWLHPMLLVKRLIIGGLIIGGIYIIYRFLMRNSSSEAASYRRAVRQTKRRKKPIVRGSKRPTSKLQTITSTKSLKKKRPPLDRLKTKGHGHLTVIEGKKKKRKRGFL